jgi:Flp pilus assembly protein TadG
MLRVKHLLKRFFFDEEGVALILVAIMLPVIIGFAVLAIDMSRVNNLHNDLQKGADAFALAGAAELDGNADAIIRARNAIDNLIANQTDFSTLNHYTLKGSDLTVTFLKSLPACD